MAGRATDLPFSHCFILKLFWWRVLQRARTWSADNKASFEYCLFSGPAKQWKSWCCSDWISLPHGVILVHVQDCIQPESSQRQVITEIIYKHSLEGGKKANMTLSTSIQLWKTENCSVLSLKDMIMCFSASSFLFFTALFAWGAWWLCSERPCSNFSGLACLKWLEMLARQRCCHPICF